MFPGGKGKFEEVRRRLLEHAALFLHGGVLLLFFLSIILTAFLDLNIHFKVSFFTSGGGVSTVARYCFFLWKIVLLFLLILILLPSLLNINSYFDTSVF